MIPTPYYSPHLIPQKENPILYDTQNSYHVWGESDLLYLAGINAPIGALVLGDRKLMVKLYKTSHGLDKVSLHTDYTEEVSVWCGVAKRCISLQGYTTLAVGPGGGHPRWGWGDCIWDPLLANVYNNISMIL